MIRGAHALLYSKDAEKVRAFLRDVLGLPHVDAGEGWLIFALPPAEVGVHPEMPGEENGTEISLMCDDLHATMADLAKKGVEFTAPVADHGYGLVTAIRLPDGASLGLYEPRHPTAIAFGASRGAKPARRPKAARAKAARPKSSRPKASKRTGARRSRAVASGRGKRKGR